MHSTLARIALTLALPTTALAQGLDQGLEALHPDGGAQMSHTVAARIGG